MKSIEQASLSNAALIMAFAMFAVGIETRGQQPARPDVSEITAAVGRPMRDVPPNAQAGPVPQAVQKRAEAFRQLQANGNPHAAPNGAATRAYHLEAIALAKTKVKNNDLDGAEEIVVVTSPFEAGSASWSLDNGNRLRILSEELATEGDQKHVQSLVPRCLRHLEDAFVQARQDADKGTQVAAKSSAAFVHERYAGDLPAAIADYKTALQVDPDNAVARESLARLERSLAILQERVQSHK